MHNVGVDKGTQSAPSIGIDRGVQVAPRRTVVVSCGTQSGGGTPKLISTGVQCVVEAPKLRVVSRGMQCRAVAERQVCRGVQCSLPAAKVATAEAVAVGDTGRMAAPERRAEQASSGHELAQSQSPDSGVATPCNNSPLVPTVPPRGLPDSHSNAEPAAPHVESTTNAAHIGHTVNGRTVSTGKKNKRKKKSATRASAAPAAAQPGRTSDASVASESSTTSVQRLNAEIVRKPSSKRAWGKGTEIPSRACRVGHTRQNRVRSALLLCALSIVFTGMWAWGGATWSAMESEVYRHTHLPVTTNDVVQQPTQPPMWVVVGGSLTLGDVMAARTEDSDRFQWAKDGNILPGRTRCVCWCVPYECIGR